MAQKLRGFSQNESMVKKVEEELKEEEKDGEKKHIGTDESY